MRKRAMKVLEEGDKQDAEFLIELYGGDTNTSSTPKRRLANLIKKHHVMV